MPDSRWEADRWLKQAADDLDLARLGLREEFFSQACFWAQQCAEKAVKAIGHLGGERAVRENSVALLIDRYADCTPGLTDLNKESRALDRYYWATRYPDASVGPAPFAAFSREQAAAAINAANRFLQLAGARVGETGLRPRPGRSTPTAN